MFRITFLSGEPGGQGWQKIMVPVMSVEEFKKLRNSERNLATLDKVRAKYDDYRRLASEGADKETLRKLKTEIDEEKSHLVQFNYSCVPNETMQLKGSTQHSPWVGMDVDFDPSAADFERKMAGAPAKIISLASELGLGMLEKSAGKGYHIVFRRQLNLTQEENLRRAADLIGCMYDERAKDITRVFYATSASPDDLYYLSSELFAPETNQPVEVPCNATVTSAPETVATPTIEAPQQMVGSATSTPAEYRYMGFPYQQIIAKYWELFNDGKTPCEGGRNTLTYELALNLRCICDFSVDVLKAVIPHYDGLPHDEWAKTITNANNEPRKGMTYRMRQVMKALREEGKKNMLPWGMNTSSAPLYTRRLPEPLRKITATTPDHLKTTVSEGVFGALATHLHGVTFPLIDGTVCEPAIMQILIFRQSRGKGSIDKPIECINADLETHDLVDRQREQDWKQANPTEGRSKRKKKEPYPEDIYIQVCQSDMTNAAFVHRLICADRNGQRPIFTQMQELDEIYAIVTNGKQDVSRIIRKAFDRKNYGQERVGVDSVTGVAPLRWNFTAATTPIKAQTICAPWVNDGTLSRCNLLTCDDGPQPKYKPVTQSYRASITPYIDRLNDAEGLIRCKKAELLANRLNEELNDAIAGTDSQALSIFASRAITIAYFKAMILYIMQGKWTKDIEDYVEWSLKRDLWVKLHFFGKKLEDEIERENKLQTYHPRSILEILPSQFSEEQFIQARLKGGFKGDYKEHLKKLKQRHKIDYDDTIKLYLKVESQTK